MDTLIVAVSVLGLLLNAAAILGIAWRGGNILGRLDATMVDLAREVATLRLTRDEHIRILERIVTRLDDIDRRVERIEGA